MFFVMNFDLPATTDYSNLERIPNEISNNYYNQQLVQLIYSMFDNDPYKRPDTTQSLKELELIERNLEIDYKNAFAIPIDKNVISSMNCVLQCFFSLENINIIKSIVKEKVNDESTFLFSFFNIFEKIEKNRNNSINNNDYIHEIEILINKLWKKGSSIDGIRPLVLYYKMLSGFKEEFNSFAKWSNKMDNFNYNYPRQLPQERFPQVYQTINDFKMNYINPFVDYFYFILIVTEKCPNCHKIFDAYSQIASFLSLENKKQNSSISNLIEDYIEKNNMKKYINCDSCGFFGNEILEKMFYTTPEYLVLDLDEGSKVDFDYQIDLSKYIETNISPRQFELYAVVNRKIIDNSELQFVCSIKEKEQWTFYSLTDIKKCGNDILREGTPSLAIYKRIANKII